MLVFGLTALQPAHIRLNPQLFFRRLCVWSVLFHCIFLFRVPEPFHFQSTFGHLAGGSVAAVCVCGVGGGWGILMEWLGGCPHNSSGGCTTGVWGWWHGVLEEFCWVRKRALFSRHWGLSLQRS